MKDEENKKKKVFFEKWWFWAIIVLIVVACLGFTDDVKIQENSNLEGTNKNTIQVPVETEEEKQEKLEKARIEKEQKEAEERARKEQEEKDFKASCNTYTFEQIARNPDNFDGTNVKLTGEVAQVVEGIYSRSLRVNITKKGSYYPYYTDTIYVNYVPETGEDKILENDIITIYGIAKGEYSYISTLGATITLPFIEGKYIELNK